MAAPGMTLEEKERAMRQVNASSNFTAEKIPGAVRFEHVEQDMLIERLLGSDSADDFFRQPPFSLTEHVSMATVDACLLYTSPSPRDRG